MDPNPPKKEDEEKESPDFEDVHDKEPIVDIGPGTKFLAIGFMAVGFLSAIYEYSQDHKDGSHLKVPETLAEVQAPITDRVYFDIQIDEEPPERLIIGVYGTVYPQTARNFVQICDTGVSTGDTVISYVNNKIQNILNDFMIIGPSKFVPDLDAAVFNNYLTKNEDLTIKHSGLGVVTNTMNRGDSHFMITFRPVKNLDHRNVAFGQVLEGAPLLQQLWKMRTIGNAGVPPQNIRVVATGVLPRRADGVELPPTSEKKN
jgi:cyclophilin family peptidyl-prolyl cis-trans isomerase